MDLIVESPLNSLSFGNVSYNILRQLWRKGVNVMLYPISNNVNLSAYDKIDKEFAIQTADFEISLYVFRKTRMDTKIQRYFNSTPLRNVFARLISSLVGWSSS